MGLQNPQQQQTTQPTLGQAVAKATRNPRVFIARAWAHVTQGTNKPFINIDFDQALYGQVIVISKDTRLQLWQNNKREGKRDADWRVSLVEPAGGANGLQ